MKGIARVLPLVAVVVLLGLSACSSGNREERLTRLRGKYGADAPPVAVVAEPDTTTAATPDTLSGE